MTISTGNSTSRQKTQFGWFIFVLTALAILVRLWGIGEHSYWFDEAREVVRSLTPWPDVLFVTDGADPPVYRLLLFPIAQLTVNEFWLRLPSALFSGGAVYLSYAWLARQKLPTVGLITALFMAVSSVQIYYAQEVSQYSFVVFLALLLLASFDQVGRRGTVRDWIVLTAVIIVSLYSYYGLAWLLPVLDLHLLWRLWQRKERVQYGRFLITHLIIGLSIALLYFTQLAIHMNRFSTNKGLEPLFVNPGWLASIQQFDTQFLDGFISFFTFPFSSLPWRWMPLFFLLVTAVGSIHLCRNNQKTCHLTVYFWGAVLILFFVRFIGIYPIGQRYALAVLPLFFMLMAAGVDYLRKWPVIAYALGILLVGVQLFFWPQLAQLNPWLSLPRESLRPAVAYLNEQAQPDDVVYVYYGAGPAYKVYQGNSPLETIYGTWFRNLPTPEKVSEIHQAVNDAPRFWLAMSHIYQREDEELVQALAEASPGYIVVDQYEAENAAVFLFVRAP
ncbi:glycosyltransferase family 39 protein [Candidatus Leptofilum sp.]|uniref:glycosyltransferase family 39 protein n=1 Tax=Candidatus Leptofilum sp. TaxID=3241576 RepID=UPI003B5A8445